MKDPFFTLADHAIGRLHADEVLLLNFAGERSDFVRFNHGKVRQALRVTQAQLNVTLIRDGRRERAGITLSGTADDRARVDAVLAELRDALAVLPPDPYLLYATDAPSGERVSVGRLPGPEEAIGDVVAAAAGNDVVGLLSSGPLYRGFASSLGQRNWHAVDAFLFDASVYQVGDKAVKCAVAGDRWSRAALDACLAQARERLPLLALPPRTLETGRYRAYLAPAAVEELASMFNWGGVSVREQRTQQSPLQKLVDGEAALSPLVHLREDTALGNAPAFDEAGFPRPAAVDLVRGGRHAGAMVSARSAREYAVAGNGANDAEAAESLSMDGGALDEADALAALDTGLYLSNLHYLNWSDRREARVTGLTRFASFWVERGRIVAPLATMRFDDSLYRMLGSELEALTRAPHPAPSGSSYDMRSTDSTRLPGALVGSFALTL